MHDSPVSQAIVEPLITEQKRPLFLGSKVWPLLILGAALLGTALLRLRLLSMPLERDEGEYAYAARCWLEGILPYVGVYNMKMPGIYACYAAIFAIGGQSIEAIHAGLLIANLATALVLFLFARRLTGTYVATLAASMFLIMSLDRSVQGLFANAENFVLLPAMLGITLLTPREPSRPTGLPAIIFAGLLLGAAWLIKQHGAVFLLCGGGLLCLQCWQGWQTQWRPLVGRLLLYALAATIPFATVCFYYWQAGAWDAFRFWTMTYASRYASVVTWSVGGANLALQFNLIGQSAYPGWILGVAGWLLMVMQRQVPRRSELLWFTACSVLAVCPGFYFRAHYFLLLLPALSLGIAWAIQAATDLYRDTTDGSWSPVRYVVPLIVVAVLIYTQRVLLFQLSPDLVTEVVHGAEPFDEAIEIGRFLREQSDPDDRIAVIGSEPEIYFYANRRAATGYIYTFAMTEKHDFAQQMQRDMIAEIESHAPEFLVYVNGRTSWQSTILPLPADARQTLMEWYESYRDAHYQLVGMVEVGGVRKMRYTFPQFAWGDAAREFQPQGENWLAVYQRRDRKS
jgi:4-amino-4-deoxy-L-arabinose transferase-like glycosyltransferase